MADALHRCHRCLIADADVKAFEVFTRSIDADGNQIVAVEYEHEDKDDCLQAALRQLAAANALIERCRPYVEHAAAMHIKLSNPGHFNSGSTSGRTDDDKLIEARALLADIDAALGRG